MNILRAIFWPFNRRADAVPIKEERRMGKISKLESANGRINKAIDELNQTVSMSHEDWCKLIQKAGECPKDDK